MACKKCTTTNSFPDISGKVIVYAAHDYMLDKFQSIFGDCYDIKRFTDYLILEAPFKELIDSIATNDVFTETELENIMVMTMEKDESLTFSLFKKAKPLNYWIALNKASDLKWILDNYSIVICFQPIVDIKSLDIFAYECLARGVKKDGSLMMPNIMFEQAKKSDNLFNLDRQCRMSAIITAKNKNVDKNIFINFTPNSIYNPEYCLRDTVGLARDIDYDFSRIVFEVVESERVESVSHLKNIFNYYTKMGFRVALDDVGSGYSSLNMLAELKPHFIKIDMNLIRDIHKDEVKKAIVCSLADISKKIGATTLAEGVETDLELNTVKECGVDLAQGYLFGKPSIEPQRSLALGS
ncbi:MAG: EAL domain-containing protein [Deferribacterales bacterium]